MIDWRNTDNFPLADTEWGVIKNGRTEATESQTKASARNWTYLSASLYTSPSTTRFLPAILVPELEPQCRKKLVFSHKLLVYVGIYALVLFFVLFSGLFLKAPSRYSLITLVLIMLVFFIVEHRLVQKYPQTIIERALYFGWLKSNIGLLTKIVLSSLVLSGLIQVVYQYFGSGSFQIIRDFGTLFSEVDKGEYWRFITGPFFHASLFHWLGNFFGLLMILPLLRWVALKPALLLCMTTAIASHVLTYAALKLGYLDRLDGFTGISAVVFLGMGYLCSNTLKFQSYYPFKFYLTIWFVTLLSLLMPEVFSTRDKGGLVAHMTGLILGLVSGFVMRPRNEISMSTYNTSTA